MIVTILVMSCLSTFFLFLTTAGVGQCKAILELIAEQLKLANERNAAHDALFRPGMGDDK